MAQKGIREYNAKNMLAEHLPTYIGEEFSYPSKVVLVDANTDLDKLKTKHRWLVKERLTVKPDQLFGKRGKHDLLLLNASFDEAKKWLASKMNQTVKIGNVSGKLTHFLIEPYVPHEDEYYVAIRSNREGDTIYFSTKGGVDIEENWENVTTLRIPILSSIDDIDIEKQLMSNLPESQQKLFGTFVRALFKFYADLGYTYLEINPFTVVGKDIIPLDLVARLDDCAQFELGPQWGPIEFPAPFGRRLSKEERYIAELDDKTGASLKLVLLNPEGRVWTMVAGGGASIIYTDTISDLSHGGELANYGEYSGNPSREFTYLYAKTILDLMTRKKTAKNRDKLLLIGGGIANFTDIAKTFTGIADALMEYKDKLKANNVKIYVRRGGPNYQEGLNKMKALGKSLGVPIEVYGPEMHMTRIVNMALDLKTTSKGVSR